MASWISDASKVRHIPGWLLVCACPCFAQIPAGEPVGTPLPEVPALMHQVEINQHATETLVKRYTYHSVQTMRENDRHGAAKLTEVSEYDVYWIGDVAVRRLVRKNGRNLTSDEQKKEDDHVSKEAAKARERRDRAAAEGKQTSPRGDEEITVSRLLELGRFTNARRIELDERPTIQVDFAGDPAAKTRTRFEEIIRDMEGTVWVDEQDKVLRRVDGHFVRAFKIGGGLLADIRQGTSFRFDQQKINGEVWLPATAEAVGAMRLMLLFHFDGSGKLVNSGYRRFSATSTILPGVGKVEDPAAPSEQTGPQTKP